MSNSDRTRSELLKELHDARERLEGIEQELASRRESGRTRREILKAAWVSPIILSLGLPSRAVAQGAPTTGFPTTGAPTTGSPTTGGPGPTPRVPVFPLLDPDR